MLNIKLLVAGGISAALLSVGLWLYFKGGTDATRTADLQTARQVIQTERAERQIEATTTERVDTERVDTERQAEAADDEIEQIRNRTPRVSGQDRGSTATRQPAANAAPRPASPEPIVGSDSGRVAVADRDAARVMQRAREARAAAVESAAKLRPEDRGAR